MTDYTATLTQEEKTLIKKIEGFIKREAKKIEKARIEPANSSETAETLRKFNDRQWKWVSQLRFILNDTEKQADLDKALSQLKHEWIAALENANSLFVAYKEYQVYKIDEAKRLENARRIFQRL